MKDSNVQRVPELHDVAIILNLAQAKLTRPLYQSVLGKSNIKYNLGYLKDSNAAAHSVDTYISWAVRLKRIENDIECPIYMLESNYYYQSIKRTRGNVV